MSNLSILKDTELLYERGIFPESTYIFKHALTREVVYDSLLTIRKLKLHENVGRAIEELYKSNLGDYFAIIADHYVASRNYEKGAEYYELAAKKAEKKVLNTKKSDEELYKILVSNKGSIEYCTILLKYYSIVLSIDINDESLSKKILFRYNRGPYYSSSVYEYMKIFRKFLEEGGFEK